MSADRDTGPTVPLFAEGCFVRTRASEVVDHCPPELLAFIRAVIVPALLAELDRETDQSNVGDRCNNSPPQPI